MKIIFLLIFDAAVQAAHQITAQTQLDKFLRNVSSFCFIILYKGSEVLKNPEIFSPLSCKNIRIGAIEIWVLKKLLAVQSFVRAELYLKVLCVKSILMKLHERPWKFDKYVCQNRQYTKSGTLCGREVGYLNHRFYFGPNWNFRTMNGCDNL